MITINRKEQEKALRLLAEEHSIPATYYNLAKDRYESFGRFLNREGAPLVRFRPRVYPQGSFRYGTVKSAERTFDLDLVIELTGLSKHEQSQAWIKALIGEEIRIYAEQNGMKHEPTPSRRCWNLRYAEHDGLEFHIDALPAISEDEEIKAALAMVVPREQARCAIVFTDTKHPMHHHVSPRWPMSNPEGYALWFIQGMRTAARAMLRKQADILPANQWNTPLQIVIRLMKHHRDLRFEHDPDKKPASIIISTLAAKAYRGETDLLEAVETIVEGMPAQIENGEVRNPSNPGHPHDPTTGENFTDKWKEKPELEDAFWWWYKRLREDLDRLGYDLNVDGKRDLFATRFGDGDSI